MNSTRSVVLTLVSSVAASCLAGTAFAQFSITRYVVAGGGGASTAGTYALGGTAGQVDAGRLSGGAFTLGGGFWAGGGAAVPSSTDDAGPDGDGVAAAPPLPFHVYAASPNPVTTNMLLAFDLPEARLVRAEVYNAAGRRVRVLADGIAPAGRNQRSWDRRDHAGLLVPAGIYFLRFDAGTQQARQKVVVVH